MAIGPYTTDILVFANNTANVTTQTNYVTLAPFGNQPGSLGDANLVNKTLRQVSVVANTLTKLTADRNLVNITDSTAPLTQAILYPLLDNAFSKLPGILPVSGGGTGAGALISNQVLVANQNANSIIGVSPGTSGNVLKSNGTSWTSSTLNTGFSIASQGEMSINATNTFTIDNARSTILFVYFGNGEGGNRYLFSNVSWGINGITNNRVWYGGGVDYQVAESGSILVGFNAGLGSTLYARVDANNPGAYGSPGTARYTILQF